MISQANGSTERKITADVLEARKINVVAEDGSPRLSLWTAAGGHSFLSGFDNEGRLRLSISVSGEGPTFVSLHDAAGNTRLQLSLTEHGPGASFIDVDGVARLCGGLVDSAPYAYSIGESADTD